MPQPYIRRRILNSWDMNEALEAVFKSQQSLCTNLLFSHRDGFAIDLETTPGRHGWGYPNDGVLVHTNHFRYFVPKQIEETYRYFSPDSLYRAERIERVLARVGETTQRRADARADPRGALRSLRLPELRLQPSEPERPVVGPERDRGVLDRRPDDRRVLDRARQPMRERVRAAALEPLRRRR